MDYIHIKGLSLLVGVGCSEEEREDPQKLEIDLSLGIPRLEQAGRQASLECTVSYLEVRNEIKLYIESRKWVLIEEVAVSAMEMLLKDFPLIHSVDITVKKFVLKDMHWAAAQFHRERRG